MPSNKEHDDNEYKGEPLDEELENGPMENRSCTDILCCLLFICFLGVIPSPESPIITYNADHQLSPICQQQNLKVFF